jgi:hypothetical protein
MENLKSALIVGLGTSQIALGTEESAETVEAEGGIGMLWSKHLLPDGQGALTVGLSTSQVALGTEESAEIVEAVGGIGMLWSKHLLPDG